MNTRITDATLSAIALRINKATGNPHEAYTKNAEGVHCAAIGNYHISHQNNGVSLLRMVNEGGGCSDVFSGGHGTKRELADKMYAFLAGYAAAAEATNK